MFGKKNNDKNKKVHTGVTILIIIILVLNIVTLTLTIKNYQNIKTIKNSQSTMYQMMNQLQSRVWMMQSKIESTFNQ